MNNETYKVELDRQTMQDIIEVFEYYSSQPCRRKVMWELPKKLRKIIKHGCFKHNQILEKFVSGNKTIWICPKCKPDLYKKLKEEQKKIQKHEKYDEEEKRATRWRKKNEAIK